MVDEALRSFRLPLWNPFMGGGMPFLADGIHGALHPASLLVAWLGTDRGVDVLIGCYVACAGLGAFALARELGASSTGAAVAAVVYGNSGFVLSMAGNLVFLAGLGSLPFCVAGLRRCSANPRPGSLLMGAGGAAILALSGDAQALMVGGVLGVALAWEVGGWRGAVRAAAAGVVGLLLAGVQLLPTAVHLSRTVRGASASGRSPLVWAFEPWRVVELVVPGLLWGPDPLMDPVYGALVGPGRWPDGGLPVPFAASVCVGLLPMAVAAVGARQGRRGRFLFGAALVLLWIALGPALGADAVLGHVPIWKAFRYTEKLVGPLTLVLAALAALGFDALAERRHAGMPIFAGAAALGLAAVAAAAWAASCLPPELASAAGGRVTRGAWHALAAVGALGVWLLTRDRLGVKRGRALLAAAVWGATVAATPAALRPGDPAARLRSPLPALAADPPGARVLTPYTYEPLTLGVGRDWIDTALRDYSANAYVALNVRARLDSLNDYEAMEPTRLGALRSAFGARWLAAARRFGVTNVVVEPPRSEEHAALHAIATSGATRVDGGAGPNEVWAVPHRPWASFPPEVRVVEGEQGALAATGRSFVEGGDAVVVEASSRFSVGSGRVLSIERALESLRIEAETEVDATLVIADAWWPGWEATIDGRGTTIFPADVLVRAVRWPAGRHVLEMRYRPPEVRTGLWVSALGLGVLGVWIAFMRRKRVAHGLEHG
jgi:hypothetical protein